MIKIEKKSNPQKPYGTILPEEKTYKEELQNYLLGDNIPT